MTATFRSDMKATHILIRTVLFECGPLTSADVATFFPETSHRNVASMVNKMRKAAKKAVYIHSWTRGEPGTRTNPRPMYALGDMADARPPRRQSSAEVSARYRRNLPAANRAPSTVFDLARFL